MFELRPFAVAAALVAVAASASATGIIDAQAPPVTGASISFTPLAAAGQHTFSGTGGFGESWTFTTDTALIRASFAAISAYSSYPTAGFIDLLKGEITKQGDSSVDVIMEGPTFSCNTAGCSGAQVLNSPKDAFVTLDAGTYFLRIAANRLSEVTSYGVVLSAAAAVPTPRFWSLKPTR